MNDWLAYIIEEKDVYKAIKKFEEIFDKEYIIDCKKDIEEDYYEEYIDTAKLYKKITN